MWHHRGATTRGKWPNAVIENFYECVAGNADIAQLFAYCNRLSYRAGDVIDFHVNCSAPRFSIRVYREGCRPTVVAIVNNLSGEWSDTPSDCSQSGCGWPLLYQMGVDPTWRPGAYIAEFTAPNDLLYRHIFFVLPPRGQEQKTLLLASTCTWSAYNDWGGSNHYEGITGPARDRFSPILSLDRPFSRGFVWLPPGAPRIPLRDKLPIGSPPRYPHMEWAYANGYSKKYASAGWATYEKPFTLWLEANGFAFDIACQHDIELESIDLSAYKCVVIVGHDEYWTWKMRDAVDLYVRTGGAIARFAGNFHWQVRLRDRARTQICYKSRAIEEDPVFHSDKRHLLTAHWESPYVNRPGEETFGLNAAAGIYAGWGVCCPRGAGGFTVYRPDHWALSGTDLYYGDVIGADSKVFGYEVDGLEYTVRNGLPFPTFNDHAHPSTEIIAMGLATAVEENHGNEGSVFFIGYDDARSIAAAKVGIDGAAAIEAVKRGSGMMITLEPGEGEIFHAGSCEWVAGLVDRDPAVEIITRNVIDRLSSR